MKVFDLNNVKQKFEFTGGSAGGNNHAEAEATIPDNAIAKKKSISYFQGTFLNGSDSELIKDHLEKYIHTDSLRLEIQLERLTKTYEKTKKELKAISLLPPSALKLNQQKVLLAKRQYESELIKKLKQEYKQIGPIHHFAMWVKEQIKPTEKLKEGLKKIVFGRQSGYIDELKKATGSLKLLVDQASHMQAIPGDDKTEASIVDVMKQYEKIESGINKATNDYNARKGPGIIYKMAKAFRRNYYGIDLPERKPVNKNKFNVKSLNIDPKLL